MFLFQAVAMQMRILMHVKQHCEFPDQLWNAFVNMVGNLGADLKLLAVLVAAALERAQTRWFCVDRTSGIPCGRVCNLAEKVHLRSFRGGGDWDTWRNQSPFMGQRSTPSPTPGPTSTNPSPMERKLKMTQVTDRRRCGVCGPGEGCPCRLVPTIPISHWGLACRGRRPRSGTSQRFTKVHSDPRCGAICGFRHLGPLPSESCENC